MTGWISFGWWMLCLAFAAVIGAVAARQMHDCPQPPPPTDRVSIREPCGCVRWAVVGRRVRAKVPCPAHMVLGEMHRIVADEQARLRSGRGHWS